MAIYGVLMHSVKFYLMLGCLRHGDILQLLNTVDEIVHQYAYTKVSSRVTRTINLKANYTN